MLTMDQLAARLGGGFLRPVDADRLKNAVADAVRYPLEELDPIKALPGFQRAAVASLSKAWNAGLTLREEANVATGAAARDRLNSLATLEKIVLEKLPANQLRPRDLVLRALGNVTAATPVLGRIEILGHTEMSPVWRPLLERLAVQIPVRWVAEGREFPDWLQGTQVEVEMTPKKDPATSLVSCASPRHEMLEAFRWVRRLLADGILPQQVAIATASPEPWDDHVLALTDSANLPVHFTHGRPVLSVAEGQLTAALAAVLLRGFSRTRIVRLVALLRIRASRFRALPSNWSGGLPVSRPLGDVTSWMRAVGELDPLLSPEGTDQRPALEEMIKALGKGLRSAAEVGNTLLEGKALRIWTKALRDGPPPALDITLQRLRIDDTVDQGSAVVWGTAADLAAAPRPWTWLVGLTSQAWPRRPGEDPLLPDHVIERDRLDPLPVHEADRRDIQTIRAMTAHKVVLSRARRDSEGRLNGASPLYPRKPDETYLAQSREAEHAASAADRLVARPDEFKDIPSAISARGAWTDWYTRKISAHDGLIRSNHPVLTRAVTRRQSASSLVRLLRDPLGYLWRYGFGWREPHETDEPLTLDPAAFGNLMHEILEEAVTRLEETVVGGFATASPEDLIEAVKAAARTVGGKWQDEQSLPPPVLWRQKRRQAAQFAITALQSPENRLSGQRSWAEIPFGVDPAHIAPGAKSLGNLPWDPASPVTIPETPIRITGTIDRLDLSGDSTRARVTDYKSGRKRATPQLGKGAELQRCLYAFAVTELVNSGPKVEARLIFPRSGDELLALKDPKATLQRLAEYVAAASKSFARGNTLPGPDAASRYYDLSFALPAGAKERYLEVKAPLSASKLVAFARVWDEP